MMGKLTAPPSPDSPIQGGPRQEKGGEGGKYGRVGRGWGWSGDDKQGLFNFFKNLTVRRNAIPVSFEGLTGSGLILHELSC